jgi:hypothetical protein
MDGEGLALPYFLPAHAFILHTGSTMCS